MKGKDEYHEYLLVESGKITSMGLLYFLGLTR
jgi:hypothetical protein